MENLKNGTRIISNDKYNFEYIFRGKTFWDIIQDEEMSISEIVSHKFEILSEEDEEIDIDEITYFDEVRDLSTWSNETLSDNQRSILNKIRELTKAVKQLNRTLKGSK